MSALTINIEPETFEILKREAASLNIDVADLVAKRVNAMFMKEELDALQQRLEVYAKRLGITTEEQIFNMVS